jgi:acetolactate synthase I/II/III large subunit
MSTATAKKASTKAPAKASKAAASLTMTGAEMVVKALQDQGVEHIFGYPGGAVLPIYDALFQMGGVEHILVRHEQGAVHAACW